jgi:hypothetical protein
MSMGYNIGPFLVGYTFDSGGFDDEVGFFRPEWTVWPDGGREPKSNSRFNKEQNDEP